MSTRSGSALIRSNTVLLMLTCAALTAPKALAQAITVTISPTSAILHQNAGKTFVATVTNTTNTTVTWSISPVVGTISTGGVYTAPSSITSPQTVTVTATSQADTTKSASATVSLYPPVAITWPSPSAINAGTALSATQLDATASVPGTFAYTPAAGYVPAAGTFTLSVAFTPTDSTDYLPAVATTTVAVNGSAPIINTVVGTGAQSFSGDGGPAKNAALFGPVGIAFDSSGNYYIADGYNHRVREVNAITGIITTVAGNGGYNSNGDGGPATSAAVAPSDVAVDAAGNLYISDLYNSTIRKVNASTGIITTIAGNGTAGYSGDGGPATSAELNQPRALTLDASGNVYIADSNNNLVRKLDTSTGIITTIAGTGTAGNTGDGGPATSAEIFGPRALEFGPSGDLYIAEWNGYLVRKIDTAGTITTVAGGGARGFVGDGGPATNAYIAWSLGLAFDSAGNLYICDENDSRVRKVDASTGIITTIAGNGVSGYSGDGGPATSAEIGGPAGLAFDPHGNLYVVTLDNRVREVVLNAAVTWPTPAPIPYGTALSGTQLNATANVPGTFVYTPAAGSVPAAGTDSLSVTFTPNDTTDYSAVTASVLLTVAEETPTLTWSAPAAINYGTPLSGTQLNATASVPGTFSYSPALGAVLPPGDQVLSVIFTPTDTTDYQTVSETVPITVNGSGGGTVQTVYNYTLTYQPNGNVASYQDSSNGAPIVGSWTYSYDSLNRLAGAQEQGSQPVNPMTNYCWSYDAFGNRTSQDAATAAFQSGSGGESPCLPANPPPISYNANNQINGGPVVAIYDAAGNVTNDGKNQYLYNADGQICAVESYDPTLDTMIMTGYIYDADGNRVAKGTITTMSCDPSANGFTTQADYVRDQAGHQLSEFAPGQDGTMAWQHTNVYANGELIATEDTTEAHFYLNDWLGTRRVQTDYEGVREQTCSSLPYGDGESCSPTPTENLFTAKERDSESGNDYFGARYYSSSMGRWMSPDYDNTGDDPEPVPYADLEGPQSLNLYSYVGNNPLYRRDPDGHSYVVYDGSANTLTLYSGTGERLGVYPADNNVDSRSSLGKLPDGTYPVLDQNSPHMHGDAVDPSDSNLQDSENGEFGPGGIFRIKAFKGPDGKIHRGVGVHAGRKNKRDRAGRKGPAYATNGCVRTCDAAIHQITNTVKTDPLTSLIVTFNQPADNSSVTTSQHDNLPCGGAGDPPCPK